MRVVLDVVDRRHEAFEEQARRTPRRRAFVAGDERPSGARLDLPGEPPAGGSHNPLTVFVNTAIEGIELTVEHDPSSISSARARWFGDALPHLLRSTVFAPATALST